MNQTSFRGEFVSKQIIFFDISLSMLHMQLNLWLKIKSSGTEWSPLSLLKPQEAMGHLGKLKSDGFTSPGLHVLDFTKILLYIISVKRSLGPCISLFDLLLVLALSCFSKMEDFTKHGNSLTVQYSLGLLHKCGSENLPESCWWIVIYPSPFQSLTATPALLCAKALLEVNKCRSTFLCYST